MLENFSKVIDEAKKSGPVTISVAAAQDKEVLLAIKAAYDMGLAKAILVGDSYLIWPIVNEIGLPSDIEVIHEPDIKEAALTAVKLVNKGEAQVLMKGLINSSIFLGAVLNREFGLRSGRMLSHLAAFEIPGQNKLVFHTDGGMNVAPSLDEKKGILLNAIEALMAIGIETPNIALLAANEQVNSKMPVTQDCLSLVEMSKTGKIPPCVIEGPMSMDVAASADAAKHKGIESKIAGNVDLFVVPTIEAGNMVGKTLVCYAGAKIGGIILGATHTIVLCSRSDNAEAKINSIALACLVASRTEGMMDEFCSKVQQMS
ncbi:MAG: phosphate acyltransferase [Deltaproteobacteria bacterium]